MCGAQEAPPSKVTRRTLPPVVGAVATSGLDGVELAQGTSVQTSAFPAKCDALACKC